MPDVRRSAQMEVQEDNPIALADNTVQPYADTNLNEKNADNAYVYEPQAYDTSVMPESAANIAQEWTEDIVEENIESENAYQTQEPDSSQVGQEETGYNQEFVEKDVNDAPKVIKDDNEAVEEQPNVEEQHKETSEAAVYEVNQTLPENTEQLYSAEQVEQVTYVYQEAETHEPYATVTEENQFPQEYTVENPQIDQQQNEINIQEPIAEDSKEPMEVFETAEGIIVNITTPEVTDDIMHEKNDSVEITEVAESITTQAEEPNPNEEIEEVESKYTEPEEVQYETMPAEEVETERITIDESTGASSEDSLKEDVATENRDQLIECKIDASVEQVEDVLDTTNESELVMNVSNESETSITEDSSLPEAQEPEDKKALQTENNPEEDLIVMYEDGNSQSTLSSEGPASVEEEIHNEPLPKPVEQSPKRRGRKPKQEIPMHVLGIDINKPVDNVLNGKSPKPRLGVKVPYRNLTSQIVTKDEIQKEIVERGMKMQEQKKGQTSFARKLTQRLAEKLNTEEPQEKKRKLGLQANKSSNETGSSSKRDSNEQSVNKTSIKNNSDLLAILEGDGEDLPGIPKNTSKDAADEEMNIKIMEREIALQQLQELPRMTPRQKYMKRKAYKSYFQDVEAEQKEVAARKAAASQSESKTCVDAPKENITVKEEADGHTLDVSEPRVKLKVNPALKTYSRKPKLGDTSESSPEKKAAPLIAYVEEKPNISSVTGGDVYVTKSSRIIKRKVIWDPDEVPTRVPKTTAIKTERPSSPVKQGTPPKVLRTYEKAPLEKKPDKSPKEKPEEKPVIASKKSPLLKTRKSMTEVDKLLRDEGTIKMLYDLKKPEEDEKRKLRSVISVEKTYKELAKKANQIKSDLVSTSVSESPKSLRRKDTPPPTGPPEVSTAAVIVSRQKSKDSTRSSPSASPAYAFPNETSYLIRRRSSSSISSSDAFREEDFGEDLDMFGNGTKRKVPAVYTKREKKTESEDGTGFNTKSSTSDRVLHTKMLTVKKVGKHVTIDLHLNLTDGYLTAEVLVDLTATLNRFSKEKDCNVVLIRSSQEDTFCLGLDYRTLVSDNEADRKAKATELAHHVGNFMKALLNFRKVLVAGIQGECSGLGVTMLPLFDMVIASDRAEFTTTHTTLGCVAEGAFLFTHYQGATELLYTSQVLKANDVLKMGLISKLCWPEKYQETIKQTLVSIAKGSRQSLESTKKHLRQGKCTQEAINSMTKELIEQWSSHECQKNFSKIE